MKKGGPEPWFGPSRLCRPGRPIEASGSSPNAQTLPRCLPAPRARDRRTDWPLVQAAAQIKAAGGLSYADAFCLATGEALDAPVATGDPEMLGYEGVVDMIDLRGAD